MQCPVCQYTNSRVLESRSAESGKSIRRRRECLQCQHRFTTYERIEFVPITVMKRDGKRESFDRSKLLRGMVRACEKTGLSALDLESIIDEIEAELQQRSQREFPTQEIGELVLQRLKSLSEVAYVRFASVYRQFQGIRDFAEALNHFQSDTDPQNGNEPTSTEEDPSSPRESSPLETPPSLCSAS
ncbi:Transcriptional repressor NrdR [Planktothrix tepida]|uniref:Transcriptional repressor NrdR n=2 Tax=Planktothrix TaxID=54304 RepID=A0A1J1LU21_9CYAN|nr:MULTISPECIES: transcriptional regulator NrdR [Planktothrix]CAD5930341.1 Transcriptional repressor NrdR [Planktothrix pseudagardhii]CAD5978530.1 Transcriptional repressor NrdR [Planktothrix tepida]CUR36096.1 Transcriptional repressor NrdR [Planktothrix tepida PCC 9214]